MNPQRHDLDDWLAAARADLAQQTPPAWIESALAARQAERLLLQRLRPVTTVAPARRAGSWLRWQWVVPVALAAVLVVSVAIVMLVEQAPAGQPPLAPQFVALWPLETIAAESQPVLITSNVPREQLAAYGFPVDPARADQPVRAEFLVSRRGAVLAVRFSPE